MFMKILTIIINAYVVAFLSIGAVATIEFAVTGKPFGEAPFWIFVGIVTVAITAWNFFTGKQNAE
jgi:hypothetical protein